MNNYLLVGALVVVIALGAGFSFFKHTSPADSSSVATTTQSQVTDPGNSPDTSNGDAAYATLHSSLSGGVWQKALIKSFTKNVDGSFSLTAEYIKFTGGGPNASEFASTSGKVALTMPATAKVLLLKGTEATFSVPVLSPVEFSAVYNSSTWDQRYYLTPKYRDESPFNLYVTGNQVLGITQIYTP